jgi:hypothetical protein
MLHPHVLAGALAIAAEGEPGPGLPRAGEEAGEVSGD